MLFWRPIGQPSGHLGGLHERIGEVGNITTRKSFQLADRDILWRGAHLPRDLARSGQEWVHGPRILYSKDHLTLVEQRNDVQGQRFFKKYVERGTEMMGQVPRYTFYDG